VNLCTGTDSLASTRTLSLFEELRSLGKTDPWLTAEQRLRTVTVNPARALRRRGQLGQITPGALADLITVPVSGNLSTVHEEIVQHELPIAWTMLDGQILA
jgi:imidazolonepropionase-like amidohydrolase